MSDPGFPPFRSAQPKSQRTTDQKALAGGIAGQGLRPQTIEEAVDLPPTDRKSEEPFVFKAEEGIVQIPRITVCAKCGSREVREAVLIGDEVYVKL